MPTSEKFCLRWNDFHENVNTAFASLRKDSDFTDVTLACEGGFQIDAHQVILSVSSPFYQNLLKRNKHTHPLIYMRGMKSDDLLAIVDFLYYGEANIYQENLDSFLNIAEELQLKGLNGKDGGGGEKENNGESSKTTVSNYGTQRKNETLETKIVSQNDFIISQSYYEGQITSKIPVALPKPEFYGDLKDLDEKIATLMIQGENKIRQGPHEMIRAYVCQVCGKEDKKSNIKSHIEFNHMDGISIPCSLCEKTFKSRNALRRHNCVFI